LGRPRATFEAASTENLAFQVKSVILVKISLIFGSNAVRFPASQSVFERSMPSDLIPGAGEACRLIHQYQRSPRRPAPPQRRQLGSSRLETLAETLTGLLDRRLVERTLRSTL
jgi:hypothetical protein